MKSYICQYAVKILFISSILFALLFLKIHNLAAETDIETFSTSELVNGNPSAFCKDEGYATWSGRTSELVNGDVVCYSIDPNELIENTTYTTNKYLDSGSVYSWSVLSGGAISPDDFCLSRNMVRGSITNNGFYCAKWGPVQNNSSCELSTPDLYIDNDYHSFWGLDSGEIFIECTGVSNLSSVEFKIDGIIPPSCTATINNTEINLSSDCLDELTQKPKKNLFRKNMKTVTLTISGSNDFNVSWEFNFRHWENENKWGFG